MAEDYVGEDVFSEDMNTHKSKIKLLRDAKSKRPPTRYGNRKDQVLWNNEREGSMIHGRGDIYTIRGGSSNNVRAQNEYHLPSKNLSAMELRGFEGQSNKPSNIKISAEFRRILKHKLTKNSEKILANLKKLGKGVFSKREGLVLDDPEVFRHNVYSSRTNPDIDIADLSSHNISSHEKPIARTGLKNINTSDVKYSGNISLITLS
jgi:hypothetical protein